MKAAVDLACKHFPNEIGTALAGTYSDDGRCATVCDVAPVTPDSKGGRSTFTRGRHGLREHFEALFAASAGQTHYVGEWHSHPGGTPVPSATDDQNMVDIAHDPATRCAECILVIVGFDTKHIETAVYVYSTARGRVAMELADAVDSSDEE